ncbi:hypothetical protein [Wenyingzhuangia sp.]|uniref:hypothetical protein n=1 Tax=Wenyingzhuangia sp. TaxID=1964193 RepID=UPI003219C5D6
MELWKVMDGQESILVENQGIIKTYVVSISSLKAKRRRFFSNRKSLGIDKKHPFTSK